MNKINTSKLDKLILELNIRTCKARIRENAKMLQQLKYKLNEHEKIEEENV